MRRDGTDELPGFQVSAARFVTPRTELGSAVRGEKHRFWEESGRIFLFSDTSPEPFWAMLCHAVNRSLRLRWRIVVTVPIGTVANAAERLADFKGLFWPYRAIRRTFSERSNRRIGKAVLSATLFVVDPIRVARVRRFTWTRRPIHGRGTNSGGRTMLLNSTIHALVASTQAFAAHVIAELFVRSASPAVFAVVPKQERKPRSMRWRTLLGQLPGDLQPGCQRTSDRSHRSLNCSGPEQSCHNGTGSGIGRS